MVELDAILARRSIRKYTSEPVTDEDIKKLLEAAMAAPTGGNRKPWHFIIIKERETLDRLAVRHPYGKMLTEAPLCIAVCGDPSLTPLPRNFIPQDCSAATMNILHATVALGLSAVWIGLALDEHYD
ncbi:MAG: nitroreductase family protein, partial [Candidatus Bathyarchaeota archaeon]